MGRGTRIHLELIRLDGDERLNAYRVMLIAVAQLATRQIEGKEEDQDSFNQKIRARLEEALEKSLNTGAFDKAGVFAQALDDLCVDMRLFDMEPSARKNYGTTSPAGA
jgi:hypothetical protein